MEERYLGKGMGWRNQFFGGCVFVVFVVLLFEGIGELQERKHRKDEAQRRKKTEKWKKRENPFKLKEKERNTNP